MNKKMLTIALTLVAVEDTLGSATFVIKNVDFPLLFCQKYP